MGAPGGMQAFSEPQHYLKNKMKSVIFIKKRKKKSDVSHVPFHTILFP